MRLAKRKSYHIGPLLSENEGVSYGERTKTAKLGNYNL